MRAITFALLSCIFVLLFSSHPAAGATAKKGKSRPVAGATSKNSTDGPELLRIAQAKYDEGDFKHAYIYAKKAESALETEQGVKGSTALLATAKCILADLLVIKRQDGDKTISEDMVKDKIKEALLLDARKANIESSFWNGKTMNLAKQVLFDYINSSTAAYNSAKLTLNDANYCQRWKDVGKQIQFYPDKELAATLVADTDAKCAPEGKNPMGGAGKGNAFLVFPYILKDLNIGNVENRIAGILGEVPVMKELKSAFKNVPLVQLPADRASKYASTLRIVDWSIFTFFSGLQLVKDDPNDFLPSSYVNELPKAYRRKLQEIANNENAKWVCVLRVESSKITNQDIDVLYQIDIYNPKDPIKPVLSKTKRVQSLSLVSDRFREFLSDAASEFSRGVQR